MGALVTAAEEIRDETTPGANTATRVGQNLVDIAQAVENAGQPFIYIASLSQSGTNPPTAGIEQTTIGEVQYAYDDVGFFILTSEIGALPSSSTAFGFGGVSTAEGLKIIEVAPVVLPNGQLVCEILSKDIDGNASNGFGSLTIKIEVYP